MIRKTHVITVNAKNNDRIEYEYDYSDRIWNVYAIDGATNGILDSTYAGCKSELMVCVEELKAAFEDEEKREAVNQWFEMFGNK